MVNLMVYEVTTGLQRVEEGLEPRHPVYQFLHVRFVKVRDTQFFTCNADVLRKRR